MPVTVAVDSKGTSVHQTGPKEWQAKIQVDCWAFRSSPEAGVQAIASHTGFAWPLPLGALPAIRAPPRVPRR